MEHSLLNNVTVVLVTVGVLIQKVEKFSELDPAPPKNPLLVKLFQNVCDKPTRSEWLNLKKVSLEVSSLNVNQMVLSLPPNVMVVPVTAGAWMNLELKFWDLVELLQSLVQNALECYRNANWKPVVRTRYVCLECSFLFVSQMVRTATNSVMEAPVTVGVRILMEMKSWAPAALRTTFLLSLLAVIDFTHVY